MNQATLGSMLTTLYDRDFRQRVRVEAQVTGDTNAPAWETTLNELDLQIQQASAQDRVSRADDYALAYTHVVYVNDNAALAIGSRLVETARLDETGHWDTVDAEDAAKYIILGKENIPGLPEPWNQVRLDLNQMTPTR